MFLGKFAAKFAAAGLFLGLFTASVVAHAGIAVGDRAPEFDVAKDSSGKPWKLKAHKGQWILLTFGASWCEPCKHELPAWDKLGRDYEGRIAFVAVNINNDPADGTKFLDDRKIQFMMRVFLPQEASASDDLYATGTFPSTFIIDPNGIVRAIHLGYHDDSVAVMTKTLDGLLPKKRASMQRRSAMHRKRHVNIGAIASGALCRVARWRPLGHLDVHDVVTASFDGEVLPIDTLSAALRDSLRAAADELGRAMIAHAGRVDHGLGREDGGRIDDRRGRRQLEQRKHFDGDTAVEEGPNFAMMRTSGLDDPSAADRIAARIHLRLAATAERERRGQQCQR